MTGDLPVGVAGNAGHRCDVVVIPAACRASRDDARRPEREQKTLVEGCGKYCPDALAIISNPVNSTVPIAAEVLMGVYNPKKVCGVDARRAARTPSSPPTRGWT